MSLHAPTLHHPLVRPFLLNSSSGRILLLRKRNAIHQIVVDTLLSSVAAMRERYRIVIDEEIGCAEHFRFERKLYSGAGGEHAGRFRRERRGEGGVDTVGVAIP